jgi:hypothetical protein
VHHATRTNWNAKPDHTLMSTVRSSLRNRVTPTGAIIATPARGAMLGNRGGAFHLPNRTLGKRRWASKQWICCRLEFKGRRRVVMSPGLYTELFFLDEVTALAAGHRPCFECRREDALKFAQLWAQSEGRPGRATAGEMDEVLHAERLDGQGAKRTDRARLTRLPAGTFFLWRDEPCLLASLRDGQPRCALWRPEGYFPLRDPPGEDAEADILTPPSIRRVMNQGYWPPLPPLTWPATPWT